MTKQSNHSLVDINKQLVKTLCTVENETLAAGFTNKSFGTVDLWNIQRQRKRKAQKSILSPTGL